MITSFQHLIFYSKMIKKKYLRQKSNFVEIFAVF